MPLWITPRARIVLAIIAAFLLLVGTSRVHVHSPSEFADHHHVSHTHEEAVADVHAVTVDPHGEDGGDWDFHMHPCTDACAPGVPISELPTAMIPISVIARRVISTRAPDGIPLAVDLPPVESA